MKFREKGVGVDLCRSVFTPYDSIDLVEGVILAGGAYARLLCACRRVSMPPSLLKTWLPGAILVSECLSVPTVRRLAILSLSKTSSLDSVLSVDLGQSSSASDVAMTISPEAMKHILPRLTDLYLDPVEAVVRETVSNAQDATGRSAGTSPVFVESPDLLSPFLVVSDSGDGMTREQVERTYISYGMSSKRDDLSQVGAFGLGAKAPLAYTSEFQVETVRDGELTSISIRREQDGPLASLSTVSTDRPNGTKVTVPVREEDFDRFRNALRTYSRYAGLGGSVPIMIDGVLHESTSEYIKICDITLDSESGLTGGLWVPDPRTSLPSARRLIKNLRYSFSSLLKSDLGKQSGLSYVLNGYEYRSDSGFASSKDEKEPALVVVEICPGLVNFASSRDTITQDKRLDNLNSTVTDQVQDKVAEIVPAVVSHGKLRDMSQLLEDCTMTLNVPLERGESDQVFSDKRISFYTNNWTAEKKVPVTSLNGPTGWRVAEKLHKNRHIDVAVDLEYGAEVFMSSQSIPGKYSSVRLDSMVYPLYGRTRHSKDSLTETLSRSYNSSSLVGVVTGVADNFLKSTRFLVVRCSDESDYQRIARIRTRILNSFKRPTETSSGKIRNYNKAVLMITESKTSVDDWEAEILGSMGVSLDQFWFGTVDELVEAAPPVKRNAHPDSKSRIKVNGYWLCKASDGGLTRDKILRENITTPRQSWGMSKKDITENVGDPYFVLLISPAAIKTGDLCDLLNGYLEKYGDDALKDKNVMMVTSITAKVINAMGDVTRIIAPPTYHASAAVVEKSLERTEPFSVKTSYLLQEDPDQVVLKYLDRECGMRTEDKRDANEWLPFPKYLIVPDDAVNITEMLDYRDKVFSNSCHIYNVPSNLEELYSIVGEEVFRKTCMLIAINNLNRPSYLYYKDENVNNSLSHLFRSFAYPYSSGLPKEFSSHIGTLVNEYIGETLDKMVSRVKKSLKKKESKR